MVAAETSLDEPASCAKESVDIWSDEYDVSAFSENVSTKGGLKSPPNIIPVSVCDVLHFAHE